MNAFHIVAGELYVEDIPLASIASAVGTPAYVYSATHLRTQYQDLVNALQPLTADICYAVKANSNLSVLRLFHELGAGFDIVSGGELLRVITAGGDPVDGVHSL